MVSEILPLILSDGRRFWRSKVRVLGEISVRIKIIV
jgi:hypothetical protein